jgi:hypothetical protein
VARFIGSVTNSYSLQILDAHDTYEDFIALHPTGNPGDVHLVGDNLYAWSIEENAWIDAGNIVGPAGDTGAQGPQGLTGPIGVDGKDSLFLGTWNSVTEFLAVYQGGPIGLPAGDWWAFVKDNANPNKIYVVREDTNSATGWVIDDNEHFDLPPGPTGPAGADGADGADADLDTGTTTINSYNPVWSGTGLAYTNTPTTGTYIKIGNLVIVQIDVLFTTVTNFGTGQYSLTIPFASKYHTDVYGGSIHDAVNQGVDHYSIKGHLSPSSASFTIWNIGSSAKDEPFDHNSPFNLTTADKFHMSFSYICE